MKILVIDDDFHIQKIVEDRLKAENFEVLKAADGIEGLRLVYDFHPDVVLLDIMMPTIDGHSVLLCIKKDEKIKNTPVIMLTAKRDKTEVMRAISSGAADYVVKPIDFRLMIKKIYEAVHAVPPQTAGREEMELPVNCRAMAEDLANLTFEIEAVAASAGVPTEPAPPRTPRRDLAIRVEAADKISIFHLSGALHPEDVEALQSELLRLSAASVSRFVLDSSDLQSLDVNEIVILKDILNFILVNKCDRRLVETDAKRRRLLRQCNMHLDHPVYATLDEAIRSFES